MKSLKHLKQLVDKYVKNPIKPKSIPDPTSILTNFGPQKFLPHNSKMASYIFLKYLESWLQSVVDNLQKTYKDDVTNQNKLKQLEDIIKTENSKTFKLLTIMKNKENQKILYKTLKSFDNTKRLTNRFDILFNEIDKCSKLVNITPNDSENLSDRLDQFISFFESNLYNLISSLVWSTNYIVVEDIYVKSYIADELSDREWNNLYRRIIHFLNVIFESYRIYRGEFEIMAERAIKRITNIGHRINGIPKDDSTISKVNIRKFNLDNNDKKLYNFVEKIYMLVGKKKMFDSKIIKSAKENFSNLKKLGVKIENYEFLEVLLDFAALKKDNTI